MSKVNNPRFPHFCRIVRYGETEPLEDQADMFGDPMSDDDGLSGGENIPSEKIKVLYEGKCRSDNRDTISDNGDVIASYRTLALPLKQDEWTEETIPQEGDKIELQRFGYKEYGLVIDRRPSNLGTHLLWKYVRN